MAVQQVDISEFLRMAKEYPVMDVRSPAEFSHAHIPGAYSLPLFSDSERAVVGTAYKQRSREDAIKAGLSFFGPKMRSMVEEVEKLLAETGQLKNPEMAPGTKQVLLVHCWRGGMRSAGVAWLLDLYGYRVFTLSGGYKTFRKLVLETVAKPYSLKVLGGYTGSGKTAILNKLLRLGEPVIDLEGLASHKGSAFGHLDLPPQPSQEMFENRLALELLRLKVKSTNAEPSCWVEDESLRIGKIMIPPDFFKQMREAPCYFLDIPFEERLQYILQDYGKADREKLMSAVLRIQKRLGGLETKTAINFLIENDITSAFRILLRYYDKLYFKGLHFRDTEKTVVTTIVAERVDEHQNTQRILNHLHKI